MTLAALLHDLRARGVQLELSDEKLVSRGPKGALTPELASLLRERKAEIIAFLRDGMVERVGTRPMPPIRSVERKELMPLSFTQERLWYLNEVDGNPAVHNLPFAFRMVGALDTDILQRCLDVLESRHEALRTALVSVDGRAMQRIRAPQGLPLARHDLRPGIGTESVEALLERMAMMPFDVANGPMIRAALARTADEEHYLAIVFHHIITDGLSNQILLRELVALYEAFIAGQPSPLKPPALQFVDYAVWQRDWLQGAALDEQLAFWKERMKGRLPTLDLATDFPRPAVRSANGAKIPFRIPWRTAQVLTAIAREEGGTAYMALLALFKTVLHRHSGQGDIIVATPVGNRTREETADIVGYVANTVVNRTQFDGEPSFREIVRRVRDGCVGTFRHQDMPFQKLVELVNPPRDLSRTPIFQAFFMFHEISSQATRMGEVELHPVVAGTTVSRNDVSLFLRELEGEILGSLEYNTDVFSRETAQRMIGHLTTLAENAAVQPDIPVAHLDLATREERIAVTRFNATDIDVPDLLVHEVIGTQAIATPDRVALRANGKAVTYRDLESRANRLARVLQSRGIGVGSLVGVCLERSTDMVVSLLAVLKSGAAYVPLDPDFPQSRLTYMLEDAKTALVLTQRSLEGRIPAGRPLVHVDDPALLALVGSDEPPPCNATPDDRAYVIYTSGSTGRPKGVELRHRNVVNFLSAMQERPGIAPSDVLVAVTTLSFDIAVLELFLPLTVGGCVVIAGRDVTTDGLALAKLLESEHATLMQATPATWRLLFDAGWQGRKDMRALCGGEALPQDLAQRLAESVRELWNMYGPTETTVWSTCARIEPGAAPVPIGSPVGNTVVRIIDRFGRPAPAGVPGELLIGGAGVAKGYLGRPELTAERFIHDPAGEYPGIPFYRTGDLVRVGPDGQLHHLGRLDHQVKVRGYRVELGEIETVLGNLPDVSEAVATAHVDATGDVRLVAYVVYRDGRQPTTSEVRRQLREHLPNYMVPGLVVRLDQMPRMPNGKIDRNALPNPLPGIETPRVFTPPASPAEQIVADAWQELLAVPRVGRHDNFFELGGHSLLSMRAVAAIASRTGKRLDPRLMFFQTVEQIAAQLNGHPAPARP